MLMLLARWVVNAAALLLVAYLYPGVAVTSFFAALIAALVLGIVNAVVRPILVLLTLPVTLLTLATLASVSASASTFAVAVQDLLAEHRFINAQIVVLDHLRRQARQPGKFGHDLLFFLSR